MRKLATLMGCAALAFSTPSMAAVTLIHIGSSITAAPGTPGGSFSTIYAAPGFTYVDSKFEGDIIGASQPFDYQFTFTLPLKGIGSGSLSTNFSSASGAISISKILVDGTDQTSLLTTSASGGQSLVLNNFPVSAFALNTIEIFGTTGTKATFASFNGGATFSAIPEPATWALMLVGFGVVGAGLRGSRRRLAAA